jgi:phosphatidylserine/phosphatidylglycerophosphate/cardiolipin synthase-like enzyme
MASTALPASHSYLEPIHDLLADRSIRVVGWPGRRLEQPLFPGDVAIRQELGAPRRTYILTAVPLDLRRGSAEALDVEAVTRGTAGAVELRLCGPDGLLRGDVTIVRPLAPSEAAEFAPETTPVGRPMIRSGSRGPAVIDAQQRLNQVHAQQLAAGVAGIDSCPLVVDGIFGQNTRKATVSFQRVAFPGQPNEWDGIIGPHTWTALLARTEGPEPPDHQLDASRWTTILRPLASGRTNLRTGNLVKALIDGRDTFNHMAADMGATGKGDFIYLLGWDNFDSFALGSASKFREIYTDAATRGVEVCAMLWDQPFIAKGGATGVTLNPADLSATEVVNRINKLKDGKAIKDDLTANNTTASTVRLAIASAIATLNRKLIPVILRIIEPDIARLTGSHHQKVLVVKRGDKLVGYCGGIDMNPNRISVVDADTGQPHHDTHCRILGPSAHDLLATFLSRWKHHPESKRFGSLRGASVGVPSPITVVDPHDAPFGGPLSVMIGRTFNPVHVSAPDVVRERGIKPALRAAIANARRFIYCEDQYLVDLDTAHELAAAIPRLVHVTILIPGSPITDMPFGKEYRRDFIEAVLSGLSTAADRAKFGVFQLTTSQSAPTFGEHTYVHSKSWVFDDELAVIGTANCNRRGYTFDSEVDAFIFEDARREGDTRQTFAQRYRMALWQHHLSEPGSALIDGAAAGAKWRKAGRSPSARVIEFDHRLPTGFLTTAGLRQAVMNRGATALHDVIDPTIR